MDVKEMISRVEAKLAENGMRKMDFYSACGFSSSAFSQWKNGETVPKQKTIDSMAKILGVSSQYLMYGIEQKEKHPTDSDGALPKNAIMVSCMIPILGTIPAGYPVLACEEILGYSPANVHNPEECFFLRVSGDSMINAGISPGDLVLIRCQSCAEEGQIVACRVNGDEATLKRFHRQKENIILMPENPNYPPRIVPQSDFDSGCAAIIGVAVQVTRNLL